MAADLITLAEGALLTQFLTPTAKHFGEAALKRIQQLGERAKALLGAAGREAQPVEEKLLLPLVQAAALESDETLATLWAALLANAADPLQKVEVQPGFADVLRQITPTDARVLVALCEPEPFAEPDAGDWKKVSQLLTRAALSFEQARLPVDNLVRLHLCSLALTYGGPSFYEGGGITPTFFARQFLAACTPPTT